MMCVVITVSAHSDSDLTHSDLCVLLLCPVNPALLDSESVLTSCVSCLELNTASSILSELKHDLLLLFCLASWSLRTQ